MPYFLLDTQITHMREKTDVLQGTLALMVLKTLEILGPLHGYGIARRIEQISGIFSPSIKARSTPSY
jgi:PadR family transcriptional regulator